MRQSSVQASGNRVLFHTGAHRKRANLELRIVAVLARIPSTNHADLQIFQCGIVGLECQNVCTRAELQSDPSGAVIGPLGVEDAAPLDPQPVGDAGLQGLIYRTGAQQLGRGECQPSAFAAYRNEANPHS